MKKSNTITQMKLVLPGPIKSTLSLFPDVTYNWQRSILYDQHILAGRQSSWNCLWLKHFSQRDCKGIKVYCFPLVLHLTLVLPYGYRMASVAVWVTSSAAMSDPLIERNWTCWKRFANLDVETKKRERERWCSRYYRTNQSNSNTSAIPFFSAGPVVVSNAFREWWVAQYRYHLLSSPLWQMTDALCPL